MSDNNALQKTGKKDVKEWLTGDAFKSALKEALPMHLTPDRFVRVALTAMMKVPKIAQCTQASLFKVLLDCSSLGLEPDGRRAHIIPYGTEATLIIDYKGLIELAKRSGEVAMWRAEIVCENDIFSWENGVVTHKVDWLKPRGKALAVYSHVKNKSGVDEYEVLTLDDVEHARSKSKAKNNGPWVTDYTEMMKKTAIRRHSKKLTLSPEFHDALEKDDDKPDAENVEFSFDDMMPKSLSEKTQEQQQTEAVKQETVTVKVETVKTEEKKQPVNTMKPLPDFDSEDAPKDFPKIGVEQLLELRAAIVKHKRQAQSFSEFIKDNFNVSKMEDLAINQFAAVMKWIETD